MKRIIGGDFPAEIYWEEKASVKLPTINLVNEPSYNLFRDEILAPLCQSGDIFISNHSYNNTLLQYMKEIGIDIIPYKIKNKREHSTIFASLLQDANSHFPRPAGPHFPARQGHIKRPVLESGTGVQGREGLHPASL